MKPKLNLSPVGDINVDFLTESHCKQCLIYLLTSFNLTSTVNFLARIQNGSSTTIDNVFINSTRKDHYSVKPMINELSDHDAQPIVINNIKHIVKRVKVWY
jgi:hypothetical protein